MAEATKQKSATETNAANAAQDNATETRQAVATDSKPAANAPTDGKVIKAKAPGDGDGKLPELGEQDQPMVVDENVYQEFYPANTKRPSYRLLFYKGQVVMKSAYDAATNV